MIAAGVVSLTLMQDNRAVGNSRLTHREKVRPGTGREAGLGHVLSVSCIKVSDTTTAPG